MLKSLINKTKTKAGRLFTQDNWNILVELVRANFKLQDHNSIAGVLWSLIGPIITSLVLYFIFRTRFGQEVHEYALFVLTGVICVNFFATATTYSVKIFFISRDFVLNSTVPRESILLSALSTHAYKFLIDLALCLIVSVFYGVFTWKSILLIIPLSASFFAFVLGINIIISLANCFAGDIQHIWMLLTRILYFATPIFYTLNNLHPITRKLIYFGNPLAPFVIAFQNVFLGKAQGLAYAYSLFIGALFFTLGWWAFIVIENSAMEEA